MPVPAFVRTVAKVFFLILLLLAVFTWGIVRMVPTDDRLTLVGVGLTTVGAVTTLLVWWLRVPMLILVVGVVVLCTGLVRSRARRAV